MSAVDDLGGNEFSELVAEGNVGEGDTRRKRAAALLLIAIVALIIWWAMLQLAPVPNVVGMTEENAIKTIQDAGFKVGDLTRSSQTDYEPGTVANQAPDAGARRFRGGAISIVVAETGDGGLAGDGDSSGAPGSSGLYDDGLALPPGGEGNGTPDYNPASPDSVGSVMIDVLGMTESAARAALRNAGYAVTIDFGPTTAGEPGRVFYQNPAPGSFVESGIRVSIWVSTGAPEGGYPYPQPPYPND